MPGPKMATTEGSPLPQADKGSPVHRLCISVSPWPLWPALWLPESWMRVPCTRRLHQRCRFQECFLWKATCFAGLQSRWPEPLGSGLSALRPGRHLQPAGPGEAPAHNSPITAPTSHLLQRRPCALQNVWLIKTIMGAHTGLFFPSRGC